MQKPEPINENSYLTETGLPPERRNQVLRYNSMSPRIDIGLMFQKTLKQAFRDGKCLQRRQLGCSMTQLGYFLWFM